MDGRDDQGYIPSTPAWEMDANYRQFETALERREPSVLVYAPKRMSDRENSKKTKAYRSEKVAMRWSPCGRCLYFTVISGVVLTDILAILIHTFAWYDPVLEGIDWFVKADLGRIWYTTGCLMQVPWFFWIWLAVLILQLFWMLYGFTLTWRKEEDMLLYEESATMPITIYLLFFLGVGGNIAWYFVWGHLGHIQWAAITVSLSALVLHFSLAAAVTALLDGEENLTDLNCSSDITWTQILVHNGIAAYCTWLSIVTMYNIAVLLNVHALISVDYSCSVAFGLIMLYMLVWFVVDILLSGMRLCLVFTPYFLAMLAFVSALTRNISLYDITTDISDSLSLVLSGAFLALTALFTVVKIITVIATKQRPPKKPDERTLTDDDVYVMEE